MILAWRRMQAEDLPSVVRIAGEVHTEFPETVAVFEERLSLFSQGCWVASSDIRVYGYAISHPAILGRPPALDSFLGRLPTAADCLYLHDVALLAQARQTGLGSKIVTLLSSVARTSQLQNLALVAVNQSAPYWRRMGFEQYSPINDVLRRKLASYSDDAQYLVMPDL